MSIQVLFDEGAQAFAQKDFAKASDAFSKALDLQPNNVTLLVNLGLSKFELGQKIEAFALFKKAEHLDAKSEAVQQGLAFLKSQVQIQEVPRNLELYEQARTFMIQPFTITTPLTFLWILILVFGTYFIRFLANKKKAFLAGEDPQPLGVPAWISFLLLLISLFWLGLFQWDSQISRGFIKQEVLSLRSAPENNAPTILQLNGGLEVKILRKNEGWLQIQYPGTFSGWVEKESVLEL